MGAAIIAGIIGALIQIICFRDRELGIVLWVLFMLALQVRYLFWVSHGWIGPMFMISADAVGVWWFAKSLK